MHTDVYAGVARVVGFIETIGRKAGIEHPIQMTLGVSDGAPLYTFRYSSENKTCTLFYSVEFGATKGLLSPAVRDRLRTVFGSTEYVV